MTNCETIPADFATKLLYEVRSPEEYPEGLCYVIQFFHKSQIYHEGDERSKRSPGHGYPAWTEEVLTVRQFVTTYRHEWDAAIERLYRRCPGRRDVAFYVMQPAKVSTRVEVDIEGPK